MYWRGNNQIADILSELDNLEEISFNNYSTEFGNTLIVTEIVQNHEKLMKVKIPMRNLATVRQFHEQFRNEWYVKEILGSYGAQVEGLLMERKI